MLSATVFNFCRDMTENDAVVISSNGQLTLTSVSTDHEGEWRCQATNSSGSTEGKTKLKVTPVRGNISTCTLVLGRISFTSSIQYYKIRMVLSIPQYLINLKSHQENCIVDTFHNSTSNKQYIV